MLYKEENKYLGIATEIIDNGYFDKSRTGIDIYKLHACHLEFSLLDQRIPVLSTRKIPNVMAPIIEMIWFISGSTDIEFLKQHNLSIWDSWVKPRTHRYDDSLEAGVKELKKRGLIKPSENIDENFYLKYGSGAINQMLSELTGVDVTQRKLIGGSIGEGAYGAQWRNWEDIRLIPFSNEIERKKLEVLGYERMDDEIRPGAYSEENPEFLLYKKNHDQLQEAIDLINNNPESRRIIVNAWNPGKLDTQMLPPCHFNYQFLPFEKDGVKYLDLALTCRSQDFLVGTVFNVMQYGALCQMVALLTGRKANKLYWTGNNTHIYANQVELFNEQHRDRSPLQNPDLKIVFNPEKEYKTINDFSVEDIKIVGYENYYDPIKYPVAV